jgi:phosphoserine phosphatase
MNKLAPAIAILVLMVLSTPVPAQDPVTAPEKPQAAPGTSQAAPDIAQPAAGNDEHFQRNLERWHKMTAEEQTKIRERYSRWVKMSSEQRQRILENWRRFRNLPSEKQQALLRARSMMGQLQQQSHEALRQHLQHFQQMPPEERQRIIQRMKAVHELLKEDFEQVKQLAPNAPETQPLVRELRVKGMALGHLPPAEIERLKNLTPEERRETIGKLVEEWKSKPHPNPERMGPREEGPEGRRRPDATRQHEDGDDDSPRRPVGPPRPGLPRPTTPTNSGEI